MPDDLYERDILLWAERQAVLLRRLAAGERVNEQVDWENLIEEVGDVGLSELQACRAMLSRGMSDLVKTSLWPGDVAAQDWRVDAVMALFDAQRRFTPSMESRIDLDDLYSDVLREMKARGIGEHQLAMLGSRGCPFRLRDLLAERPDLEALLRGLMDLTATSEPVSGE